MSDFLLLYVLFLKATLSSFSGPATLPIIREDFVAARKQLTDRELNTAVVAGRITPGPKGNYLVCVGQMIDGPRGAIAAWLALITPALLVLPLLHWLGKRSESPGFQRVLNSLVLSSCGLSLTASLPLARDAIHSFPYLALCVASGAAFLKLRVETVWIIGGAALLALAGEKIGTVEVCQAPGFVQRAARKPRQVRKEATVLGVFVCRGSPGPGN